ncbi:hypothetical protein GCM10010339_59430 [Streptomyces alanosinicus]|uniref:Uncharacterized protein n=1 Tax=Streptomyces alanosinicus TaxID=68171 RepID=A0A918YMW1_9ACTN|nr:hypothetical protein GCM10010339_59430 [Streptomyces alanosinicus]
MVAEVLRLVPGDCVGAGPSGMAFLVRVLLAAHRRRAVCLMLLRRGYGSCS